MDLYYNPCKLESFMPKLKSLKLRVELHFL
jgi:hypothetical protein